MEPEPVWLNGSGKKTRFRNNIVFRYCFRYKEEKVVKVFRKPGFKLLSHSVYCTADGVLDGGGEETEREGEDWEGESEGAASGSRWRLGSLLVSLKLELTLAITALIIITTISSSGYLVNSIIFVCFLLMISCIK